MGIKTIPEPVGVKKPTFANDDKIHSFERVQYSNIALLCEVQAYPIATIRYSKCFKLVTIKKI